MRVGRAEPLLHLPAHEPELVELVARVQPLRSGAAFGHDDAVAVLPRPKRRRVTRPSMRGERPDAVNALFRHRHDANDPPSVSPTTRPSKTSSTPQTSQDSQHGPASDAARRGGNRRRAAVPAASSRQRIPLESRNDSSCEVDDHRSASRPRTRRAPRPVPWRSTGRLRRRVRPPPRSAAGQLDHRKNPAASIGTCSAISGHHNHRSTPPSTVRQDLRSISAKLV